MTSTDIDGDWSDPVYLNSSGFDPSLFHDDDGRSLPAEYAVGIIVLDRIASRVLFVQEFSAAESNGSLGNDVSSSPGITSLGLTEGPHLYKRGGYYHLLTAEGGTGWGHAVTMARAKAIAGAYELHPDVHVLSARHRPDLALQRAGHADLVDTADGSTYMVYLCGRPLPNRGRCTLGRETAIQRMVWGNDGWLRTVAGDGIPVVETEAPRLPAHTSPPVPDREHFDDAQLPIDFQCGWAIAVARRLVQSDGAPGIPAAVRAGNGGQPVQPGSRRPSAAVALLQRVDDRRVRPPALPADGRTDLLLQQLKVPLPVHFER